MRQQASFSILIYGIIVLLGSIHQDVLAVAMLCQDLRLQNYIQETTRLSHFHIFLFFLSVGPCISQSSHRLQGKEDKTDGANFAPQLEKISQRMKGMDFRNILQALNKNTRIHVFFRPIFLLMCKKICHITYHQGGIHHPMDFQ